MARKRMFSNDIINTDDFIDMPHSSQNLYFHLGMNADDEGFIQPKRIMRMIQAKDDDLKVLLAKKFIHLFNSGVLVIADWHTNNYIDKNKWKPTEYVNEMQELRQIASETVIKYELTKSLTLFNDKFKQKRREEKRREEKRIEYTTPFEDFWSLYPVKKAKKTAEAKWKRLSEDKKLKAINDIPFRVENDSQWKAGYVPNPTTYINQERWEDEISKPRTGNIKKLYVAK